MMGDKSLKSTHPGHPTDARTGMSSPRVAFSATREGNDLRRDVYPVRETNPSLESERVLSHTETVIAFDRRTTKPAERQVW